MHRGKATKDTGRMKPASSQGQRPPGEIRPADALILDFQPPELQDNWFLISVV